MCCDLLTKKDDSLISNAYQNSRLYGKSFTLAREIAVKLEFSSLANKMFQSQTDYTLIDNNQASEPIKVVLT